MKNALLSLIILVIASVFVPAQDIKQDQLRLTTPGAPWMVVFDNQRLNFGDVGTKPDEKSAYFLMFNKEDGINVSIYIEPVEKCKTSEQCRDFVLTSGNPAWGKYQDLAKSSIGNFSCFEFFRPEVQGEPLKVQDVYAERVDNGYWVDLHISKVLYKKEDKPLIENLINSVRFLSKTGGPPDDTEGLVKLVQKTAEGWLPLWETARCSESYRSLTSISRQAVTEKNWIDYCGTANKALGKLKSRKLIATALIKSLPGKTDYAGAELRYQSVFENGPVIEFVSLTMEKDGAWTVSNYLTQ